jgi:hypothetical protein
MFVDKGVNVFPTSIQEVLHELQPRLTGEFQVALNTPPLFAYAPGLLVDVSTSVPSSEHAALIRAQL